jgi:peptidoglycan/LPS O-acetylase OafA/YrhL
MQEATPSSGKCKSKFLGRFLVTGIKSLNPVQTGHLPAPMPNQFDNSRSLPAPLAVGLQKSHLPSLDGIRAVAVALVVFYHLGIPGVPGGMGVLIFFVLSGFLITWLLLKEEERFGHISLKLFYARRTLRIFPAFYVYWFLIIAVWIISSRHIFRAQALSSFFYVSNYYQAIFGDPNTGLSHTWSLGVEEQFYVLWPVTFLLLRNNGRRIKFLLWSIGAVWLYREFLIFVIHRSEVYIYEAFDTRADHLLIGCILAVALRERMWPRVWQLLVESPWRISITVSALVASATMMHFGKAMYRDSLAFIIDPMLAAALIVQGTAYGSTGLGRILNWGWIRYLGVISYSIYLYHPLAMSLGEKLFRKLPGLRSVAPLGGVLSVVAAATTSYLLLEQPLQKLRARFARRPYAPELSSTSDVSVTPVPETATTV